MPKILPLFTGGQSLELRGVFSIMSGILEEFWLQTIVILMMEKVMVGVEAIFIQDDLGSALARAESDTYRHCGSISCQSPHQVGHATPSAPRSVVFECQSKHRHALLPWLMAEIETIVEQTRATQAVNCSFGDLKVRSIKLVVG